MTSVGQPERVTQNRVIALFRDQLDYRYVGDWTDRDGNSNIEDGLLSAWLTKCGYTPAQISAALHRLRTEADHLQPRALRQQPRRLQPAALRRAREDRGGQGDGNRPPHQLAGAGAERFRHCRGSDAQGEPGAAARRRAVCEWHRRRRFGVEEQPREHRRRHSSEPLESATGVQRLVLQHRAVHFCGQRLRGVEVTALSARRKSSSSSGRRTRTTTAASSSTSTCSRCAARTG